MAFLHASAIRSIRNRVSIATVVLLLLATTGLTGWFLLHQPPDPTHVINLNDDGPGSLRWAIANVSDGSTITIDQSLNGRNYSTERCRSKYHQPAHYRFKKDARL